MELDIRKMQLTENVLQNTPNCTIDKKSGECAPIPLNIVCAVMHYPLFLHKNNYYYLFLYKILAKYSPKRTIFKIFSGEHAPSRHANTSTFPKIFLTPPK